MVGLNKKLGGAVSYLGSSSMTMKSALIISLMLISIMQVSSSALAAESKDDVGVSSDSSSFNKRRWTNSNVVEGDAAAADGGKRVLVSEDRRIIIDGIQRPIIPFLATIYEYPSIRLLTLTQGALCAITFLQLLTSSVVGVP